jgi:LacI family transcriptional regulator
MVSITEVAAVAKVSDRTVSRVVHNDKRVTPKTRARVQAAINALGYVPNRGALLMRTNKSGIIGLITDVVSTTPFSTDIIHGIQSAIEESDYSLLTVNTAGDPERTAKSWRELKGHRVDGVLYVTMFQRKLSADEVDPGVPTVIVNCHSEDGANRPAILPEESAGMAEAVSAAVSLGHRKFGYVRLNASLLAAAERERALRATLAEHGLSLPDKWCVSGVEGPLFEDTFVAYDTVKSMLDQADRPSVLFCGNDEIALQAFSAAARLGLRVPEDISLVGFDDFRVVSEVMRPRLATVALPYFQMGQAAVRQIAGLVQDQLEPAPQFIACQFMHRESLSRAP